MANSSQTYSTETSIQNDFKIFLGKKSEIAEILALGKVVDRKWYLAWDTGEIYIGNKLHKLMKFGGSNENLTGDSVKEIIEAETRGNFNEIRKQMTNALSDYTTIKNQLHDFQIEFSTTLAALSGDTRTYIQNKVSEVLANYSDITYSKQDIDLKLASAVTNIKTYIQNNYIDKSALVEGSYATQDYVDGKFNGSLIYLAGNSIKNKVINRDSGLYFSTTSSDDGTIQKAHIYYLMNGSIEDMTPAGSGGGGGGYIQTTLGLLYNYFEEGVTKQTDTVLLELGTSFKGQRVFTWSVSDGNQINGKLSFLIPSSNIPNNMYSTYASNINPLSQNHSITLTDLTDNGLLNPAEGTYKYTIAGTDKQGNALSASVIINVVGPIYFGESVGLTPDAGKIKTFQKVVKAEVAGEYLITINTTGHYAWVCVPDTMTITNFTLSGFKAPFEPPQIVSIPFGNVTTNYKCYRSTESLRQGRLTVSVV